MTGRLLLLGLIFLALGAGLTALVSLLGGQSVGPSITRLGLAVDASKPTPETVPQMTNTMSCEFRDVQSWACRDGMTLTAADSGKLYLYRLGPVERGIQVSHAHLRGYGR